MTPEQNLDQIREDISNLRKRLAPLNSARFPWNPDNIPNYHPGDVHIYPVVSLPPGMVFNTVWYSFRTGTLQLFFNGTYLDPLDPRKWPQPDMFITESANPIVLPIGVTQIKQFQFACDPNCAAMPTGSFNFAIY